jgi:hypothetical protein
VATSPSLLVLIGVSMMTRSPVTPTAEVQGLMERRSPESLEGRRGGEAVEMVGGGEMAGNLRCRMMRSLIS